MSSCDQEASSSSSGRRICNGTGNNNPPPPLASKPNTTATSHGQPQAEVGVAAVTGRERLKRVREEVAGRVEVPDKWSHEELLRDWMDFSSFNALLAPKGIASARQALVSDGRRGGSRRMRIEGRC